MSPKVLKDVPQTRSSNIKNIYIQKINSLMKMSKDTVGKSEIQALNQTNRKKIKKHLSQAEKNNIRLQKNRQSAKKARQRKKIYVKLLQQQEKRLALVLQQTQNVEVMASQYVQNLNQRKNTVTKSQNCARRKSSDNNIDKIITKTKQQQIETYQKVEDKIFLLRQIIEELTELSKYAYWKESKPDKTEVQNLQENSIEQDFFNVQQVLDGIQVVQMKKREEFDMNLDDLLNVPYDQQYGQGEKDRIDIKSLIQTQYETVSRCLRELGSINSEAQQLLKQSSVFKNDYHHGQDSKNPELTEFKKKNTIVPEYEIKKTMPRRIDSLNSLSSANRSIMTKNKSLFSLNNYFINMEQAETKILSIDRAIQEINRILTFKDEEEKDQRQDDFEMEKI